MPSHHLQIEYLRKTNHVNIKMNLDVCAIKALLRIGLHIPENANSIIFSDKCLDSNGQPTSTDPFQKPGDCDNFYQVKSIIE